MHWQLPDGMDEMLPDSARALETMRRRIYDQHLSWGYAPVHPPFVEYLESLLSSTGQDFDRHTLKMADPVSGRMIGVRADMTPQVARIDAHTLGGRGVSRLFYMGTVIRAHAEGVHGSRSPLQLGAEIFGHSGIESDIEVIRLMLHTLENVGVKNIHIDLGHADIFRSLSTRLKLSSNDQASIFELLQRKAEDDLQQLSASLGIDRSDTQVMCELCSLNGDSSVLTRADELLAGYGDSMSRALASLRTIGNVLGDLSPHVSIHYDLAEVRGFRYHNGVVFAAYVPQRGSEVARGGRYDGIGEVFGSSRAATGYSTDLKTLMGLVDSNVERVGAAIKAPFRGVSVESTLRLQDKISALRASGALVVTELNTEWDSHDYAQELVEKDGTWLLEKLK